MTREERAQLLIKDWDTYKKIVPEGYWLQILDGMSKKTKSPSERNTTEPEVLD